MALSTAAHAATIIAWDANGFVNSPDNQTGVWNLSTGVGTITLGPQVSLTTGFTRGAGLIVATVNNTWGGGGFSETSQSAAITAGDFLYFTIQAEAGSRLSFSELNMNLRRPVATYIWQYQIGAGAFTDIGSAVTVNQATDNTLGTAQAPLDLASVAGLQLVTDTVTFRLVAWNATVPMAIGRLTGDDLVLSGTVSAVPEPASAAMLLGGLALGAVTMRRRRRA